MSKSMSNAIAVFMQQAYWHKWSKAKAIQTIRELRHEHSGDSLCREILAYFAI